MKPLTKFSVVACFSLLLLLGTSWTTKVDNLVIIWYQQLANFQSWNLNGKGTGDKNGMWHVYMLRGISNKAKDSQPFFFNLQKVKRQTGGTVNSSSSAMLAAAPETMPINFTASVNPKSVFTVPFGTGVLFFIKEENDLEQDAHSNLTYKPNTGEHVLLLMLNGTSKVMFGQLDQAFLSKIHAEQNKYENSYDAQGNKK